jgi:hypothetical protein
MRPAQYPLLLRWHNLARAEGFEPPSSALETDSLTLSLRPQFSDQLSKSNKKPGARPGPVHKQIHSDPQDTAPQMTRLVILVITCLKVCCITLTRRNIVPQLATICNSILVWIKLFRGGHRHTDRCQPMQDSHGVRDRRQNLVEPLVAVGRLIESTAAQLDSRAVYP